MAWLAVSAPDTDLAEVLAAGEVVHRCLGLLELENAVDYRTHPADADGPVHVLEHLARAHPDPHDMRAFEQDSKRVDLAAHSGEQADHGNEAAGPHRLQRADQG